MKDSNDTSNRLSRRSVLKTTGGALAGLGAGVAAEPAMAQGMSIHRKWGRTCAENMAEQMNNSLEDYVDTISDYSDDPDEDPYYCPSDYPDYVCDFLSTVDQSHDHYLNPENTPETGVVHEKAADAADAAKTRVENDDYIEGAIKTGRALHFIQDAATLVHAGREAEQGANRDIHHDFEIMVRDNWSYFEDNASQTSTLDMSSKSDVQSATHGMATMSHAWLQEQWDDIEDHGSYNSSTKDAQGYCITDGALRCNGMLEWAWQNA